MQSECNAFMNAGEMVVGVRAWRLVARFDFFWERIPETTRCLSTSHLPGGSATSAYLHRRKRDILLVDTDIA